MTHGATEDHGQDNTVGAEEPPHPGPEDYATDDYAPDYEQDHDPGQGGPGGAGFVDWANATLRVYERPTGAGQSTFCARWWLHPEAVMRFRALYQAYQTAVEKNELSSWWVNHWDAHVKAL